MVHGSRRGGEQREISMNEHDKWVCAISCWYCYLPESMHVGIAVPAPGHFRRAAQLGCVRYDAYSRCYVLTGRGYDIVMEVLRDRGLLKRPILKSKQLELI